jgi:hypothetical protein
MTSTKTKLLWPVIAGALWEDLAQLTSTSMTPHSPQWPSLARRPQDLVADKE